jgi:endonuclease/exonuclease/phosphatase family metal-dependent hydrolase
LSETPEKQGSRGWDTSLPRIATWVVLEENSTKQQIFYMNLHLDHTGEIAQKEGAKLCLKEAALLGLGMPIIITGDFNFVPGSAPICVFTESRNFKSSSQIAKICQGVSGTFHSFGKVPIQQRLCIDHVFVSNEIDVLSYNNLPDQVEGVYFSDHTPLLVELQIR